MTDRFKAKVSAAVAIISAIATAAVLIIGALDKMNNNVKALSAKTDFVAVEQSESLNQIHVLVNSNLKAVRDELSKTLNELAEVRADLARITGRQVDEDAAEEARKAAEGN